MNLLLANFKEIECSLKLNFNNINIYTMDKESDPLPIQARLIDIVICNNLFLYHDINDFKQLKFVQLTSAGLDRFPVERARLNSIQYKNASNIYSIPISEQVIFGVLYLYKRYHFFEQNKLEHKWEKNRNLLELNGKNVCVFGCGSIGKECAKKFKSFGCKVYGVDLRKKALKYFDKIVSFDDVEKIIGLIDINVSCLPLTKLTKNIFNNSFFNSAKNNSIFVNISRGEVCDQSALVEALKSRLFGAVLDVFPSEPLSADNELWDLNNVIITPHNSYVGDGNFSRLTELIIKNISEFIHE